MYFGDAPRILEVQLLTHQDVLKKAGRIAEATQTRYMPPWPPDPSYSHFVGERVLKDREIETIKRWVENGSPEGNPAKLPRQPAFPEGSVYGKPDLILRMRKPLAIPGDNKDQSASPHVPSGNRMGQDGEGSAQSPHDSRGETPRPCGFEG